MRKSTRAKSGTGGRPNKDVRHTNHDTRLAPDGHTITKEELEQDDDIRETIRLALVKNLPNVSTWLEKVGDDDPKGALTMFRDFTEFVLPKLQRTDSKLDSSNPVQVIFESVAGFQARKEQQSTPKEDDN